jgi:hypothetical protein
VGAFLALAGSLPGGVGASAGPLRTQNFDSDPTCSAAATSDAPCWEGRNNRLLPGTCPTTDQRFGYSATANASSTPGEIGGRVWASYTRAYYGKVLPRARNLSRPLSASGTLLIRAGGARWAAREDRGKGLGQGAPTFGFFNHDSREWRTNDSLGMRVEEDGGSGLFAVGTEYGTGNFRAAGHWLLAPRGGRHLIAGRRYRWRLAYNPSGANRNGAITLSIQGVGASTQALDPGDRSFGANFNRFGLINHMIEGNDATLYFGDLTIDGVRENLSRGAANWAGSGNQATFADCMIDNRHDFGYTGAGNRGGPGVVGPAPAHAAGGVLWQTEAGLGPAYSAYYADRIPALSLNDEIYAQGTVVLARASSDSAINFGFFDAATADVGQNVPHNFVGLNTDGPSRVGHYLRPVLRSRSGPLRRPRTGPTILPNGARHRWTFHYVPGPRGAGRLTATFDGRTQSEPIPAWVRAQGATLNRFGMRSITYGGHGEVIYLDDLRYTARPASRPVGR